MKTIQEMKEELKNVKLFDYRNLMDLFIDNLDPQQLGIMSDDMKDYFSHLLDFETIAFFILDYENIIIYDFLDGSIIDVITLEKLFADSIKDYNENN